MPTNKHHSAPHFRLIPEFLQWLSAQGFARKTRINYISDLQQLAQWLYETTERELDTLQTSDLEHFIAAKAQTGISHSTQRRHLATFRKFAEFLEEHRQYQPCFQVPATTSTPSEPKSAWKNIRREFELALRRRERKDSIRQSLLTELELFISAYPDSNPLEIVTKPKLAEYLAELRRNNALTPERHKYLNRALFAFAHWAVQQQLLPCNPFANIVQRKWNEFLNRWIPLSSLQLASLWLFSSPQHTQPLPEKLAQNPFMYWYWRYHRWSASTYLHAAVLIIFAVMIGIVGYQQFYRDAAFGQAYPSALVAPQRILSFQGRLTDSSRTPITSATSVTFRLFDVDSGGTQLWENVCTITPDQDGVFSIRLGDTTNVNCSGGAIGSGIFSENDEIWLEIEVASEVLTPRQQIATVAYALNSETLQGFPASATGDASTIPVINSSGELVIGTTTPKITATSNTFTIQGESIVFEAEAGAGGGFTFNPDGNGIFQIFSESSTNDSVVISNSNLNGFSLITGEVNNDNSASLITLAAGSSLDTKFLVDTLGNTTIDGFLQAPGATLSASYAGSTPLTVRSLTPHTANLTNWRDASNTTISSVQSDGSLTIGGATTSARLEVRALYDNADVLLLKAKDGSRLSRITATDGGTALFELDDASGTPQVYFRTDGSNNYINSGNLGIGNNNPLAKLHVTDSTAFGTSASTVTDSVFLRQSGGTPGDNAYGTSIGFSAINRDYRAAAITAVQTTADADEMGLAFFTHGATAADPIVERLRILGAGNVLINTTTAIDASAMLNVNGPSIFTNSGDGNSVRITNTNGSPSGFSALDIVGPSSSSSYNLLTIGNTATNDAGNVFTIAGDGQIGIGTNTPAALLDVNGEIQAAAVYTPKDNWDAFPAAAPDTIQAGGTGVYDGADTIYVFRGAGTNTFWKYSISSNAWTALSSTGLGTISTGATSVYTGGDSIYVLRAGTNAEFYRYSISGDNWTTLTSAPAGVAAGAELVYTGGNYLYTARGDGTATFYRYSISDDSWSSMTNAPGNIGASGGAAYTGGDLIYVLAGGTTTTFYSYSIANDTWDTLTATPGNVTTGSSLIHTGGNYLYAFQGGGQVFWRYSIATNEWMVMSPTPAAVGAGADLIEGPQGYLYALRGNTSATLWRYEGTSNLGWYFASLNIDTAGNTSNVWEYNETLQTIYPSNANADLLIGGHSTASSKLRVESSSGAINIGVLSLAARTASISANHADGTLELRSGSGSTYVLVGQDLKIGGGDILGPQTETRISLDDTTDTVLMSGTLNVEGQAIVGTTNSALSTEMSLLVGERTAGDNFASVRINPTTTTARGWSLDVFDDGTTAQYFQIYDALNAATRMVIDNDGDVGIGTSNPSGLVHLHTTSGSGDTRIRFTRDTSNTSYIGQSLYYDVWSGENTDMRFGTNNTQRMTIQADGDVGIGTASPSDIFTVYDGSTAKQIHFGGWDTAGNADIDGLIPGSTAGSLITGASAAHVIVALQDNDINDQFSIISGGGNWNTDTTYDTVVLTANAEGKVGIRTSNPLNLLQVGPGTAYDADFSAYLAQVEVDGIYVNPSVAHARVAIEGTSTAGIDLVDSGGTANERWSQLLMDGDKTYFRSINDSAALAADYIIAMDNGTGYVGIGMSDSTGPLEVAGAELGAIRARANSTSNVWSDPGQIALKRASSTPFLSFHSDTGTRLGYIQANSTTSFIINTEASSEIRLIGGSVAVGNISPSETLDVSGTFNTSGGFVMGNRGALEGSGSAACSVPIESTAGIWFADAGDCTTTFLGMQSVTNGSEAIGFYLAGAWRLYVNNAGTVTVPGLTASRLVVTNGSSQLANSITAANLAASVSDITGVTGTENLVLSASPAFTGQPEITRNSATTTTSNESQLELIGNEDVYISFHRPSVYGAHFGLDGGDNWFSTQGWSAGGGTGYTSLRVGLFRTDDGAATGPAHSFINDSDTGMYRSGTNQLAFATYSNARVRINGSSNSTSIGTGRFDWALSAFDSSTTGAVAVCSRDVSSGAWFSVSGCPPSSIRYKKNVENLETEMNALDTVMRMRPVVFDYKENNNHSFGFIAEEMESLSTLFVEYGGPGLTPDQVRTVKYENLTAVLAGAIQTQQGMIVELQQAVSNQSNSHDTLRNQLLALIDGRIANALVGFAGGSSTSSATLDTDFTHLPALETNTIAADSTGTIDVQVGNANASHSGSLVVSNFAGQQLFSVTETGITAQQATITQMENRFVRTESLMVTGDATVAGSLTAQSGRFAQLQAQDATISGTLHASRFAGTIDVDQVASFEARVRDLVAQQQSEPAPDASAETLLGDLVAHYDELMALINQPVQTENGENLWQAVAGDLSVDGTVFAHTLAATNVTGTRQVAMTAEGLSFTLPTDCDLNVDPTCGTFSIQPSGEGRLSLLADLMLLEPNGVVRINGDLLVAGRLEVEGELAADTLQPRTDTDLEVQLASGSADSALIVRGQDNKQVASFRQDGSTQLNKIVIAAQEATADQNETAVSIGTNATTGTAILPANSSTFTIRNEQLRNSSLVYLTPTSSTQNRVLYVASKAGENPDTPEKEGQFIVAIDQPVDQDITFNWWIVEGAL